MVARRARMGAAAFNGFLHSIGGYQDSGYTNTVERFNPLENKWITVTHLKHSRAATVLNGKMYVFGYEN